jgi:hypothetical protein
MSLEAVKWAEALGFTIADKRPEGLDGYRFIVSPNGKRFVEYTALAHFWNAHLRAPSAGILECLAVPDGWRVDEPVPRRLWFYDPPNQTAD